MEFGYTNPRKQGKAFISPWDVTFMNVAIKMRTEFRKTQDKLATVVG